MLTLIYYAAKHSNPGMQQRHESIPDAPAELRTQEASAYFASSALSHASVGQYALNNVCMLWVCDHGCGSFDPYTCGDFCISIEQAVKSLRAISVLHACMLNNMGRMACMRYCQALCFILHDHGRNVKMHKADL